MPAKGLLYLSYVQPEIVSGCKMYTSITLHLTRHAQLLPLMDSLVIMLMTKVTLDGGK